MCVTAFKKLIMPWRSCLLKALHKKCYNVTMLVFFKMRSHSSNLISLASLLFLISFIESSGTDTVVPKLGDDVCVEGHVMNFLCILKGSMLLDNKKVEHSTA